MRKQDGKSAEKTSRTQVKKSKSATPAKRGGAKNKALAENNPSAERFVKDLVVRGEAVKPDSKGRLPLDATHAITKENPDGTVEVKRARYKAF